MGSLHASADANAKHRATFSERLAASPATTRGAYLRDFDALVALCPGEDVARLSRAELGRALALLHARGLAGRSLARVLSGWRAFYRHALDRGARSDDPTLGLRAPRARRTLPHALSPDEAARLCSIEGDDALAARDRALLELAYSSGLRLSELARASVERLDLREGELRVIGKGSKERIVPVGASARQALEAWLRERAALARRGETSLFVTRNGSPLSPRAIQARLAQWAIRQGLPGHVHPHMLRHSFASHLLQSSGDLRAVQELLGHASIASTQVYTHLDHQALARVYDAAHPRARKARARKTPR
jgi:integrase/recombinase XerC